MCSKLSKLISIVKNIPNNFLLGLSLAILQAIMISTFNICDFKKMFYKNYAICARDFVNSAKISTI